MTRLDGSMMAGMVCGYGLRRRLKRGVCALPTPGPRRRCSTGSTGLFPKGRLHCW